MYEDLVKLYKELDNLINKYKLDYAKCNSCEALCCRIKNATENEGLVPLVSPGEKYLIEKKISNNVSISLKNTIDSSLPCRFLKDNKCIIYEERPIDCRKYYCEGSDENYQLFHRECMKLVSEYFNKHEEERKQSNQMIYYNKI